MLISLLLVPVVMGIGVKCLSFKHVEVKNDLHLHYFLCLVIIQI